MQAGLQRRSHEYAYGALWTVGHTSSVRGELRQVVRGTHDLIGLLPLGKGRCNFFCSQNIADYDRVRLGGFDAWRDRIVSLCPEAAEVISHLDGFDGLALTRYNHASLTGLTRERLVLLGDAGRAMSPHLGQGANLALVDAWVLARCLDSAASLEMALAEYDRARRAQLRYYGAVTFALSPFFQSQGTVLGLGRDIGLPLISKVRPLRRFMVKTMAGLVQQPADLANLD